MDSTIHFQVLGSIFAIAVILGAVTSKTNFCTMGAVSDWVNIGDTGRLRAWVFAIAVALAGVTALEGAGIINLSAGTFPPYRTANFAWIRYLVGGLMFGVGMTLSSGCGNKTLVRLGGGNLKSLVVLVVASICAYAMLWTPVFEKFFYPWISATTINLQQYGVGNQEVGTVLLGMFGMPLSRIFNVSLAAVVVVGLLVFVFRSADFRSSRDNILGGAVMGLAVVAGWWITGGSIGQAWKDYAEMSTMVPSRVQTQSFTFVSPMGDTVRYLLAPRNLSLVNFGVVALTGVIVGSSAYALATRRFRIEWFASWQDFGNHVLGGVLLGVGGVLAMGCTIGQGVTGVSTLAVGSIIAFFSIVIGASGTMKYQYWRMMQEA